MCEIDVIDGVSHLSMFFYLTLLTKLTLLTLKHMAFNSLNNISMAQYNIYIKASLDSTFGTYYTTVECNSEEEAQQIADNIGDLVEKHESNSRDGADYWDGDDSQNSI